MIGQQNNSVKDAAYGMFLMITLLGISTAIGYLFVAIGFPETNIVIVYLFAVLLTARVTRGYIFGLTASVIAACAFNYFFIEPYFAFALNASNYIITFIIMMVTALITSTLTSHAKQNALKANEKEKEATALYTLTNRLTEAVDMHDMAAIITDMISDIMCCKASCLCFDEDEIPEQTFIQQISPNEQIRRRVTDADGIKARMKGLPASYDIEAEFCDWPICGRQMILGVVRIPKHNAEVMNEAQTRLLRSMIENTVLAMDRFRAAQQHIKSNEDAERERYRSNLLRAISHDLRTPLSGIMGTLEILMDMTSREDPRYSLAEGIYKEADWLHSLVENILNLTRLQDGKLTIGKQLEAVEEIVGGAVGHISRRAPEREITVHVPEELLLVPMDAKLIEQVLINLLENAVRHTLPQNEISVSVTKDVKNNRAVFLVADRGKGIDESDLPHIFQFFYTSRLKHADAYYGIGLGLAICDTIVKAHGGSIEARNRTDGPGAEFIFVLPLEVDDNEQL